MKIIECVQGDERWHRARLGVPTASQFHRILSPTGKPSTQAEGYLHELVAERVLERPASDEATNWMQRGTDMEREAVAWYELHREVDTRAVGFCLADDGRCGCSPDRLVGGHGGVEIKVPSAAVHVGYLLDDVPKRFKPQVQGCLWITGASWWDVLSYNPELPVALVRVGRDEEYISDLARAVATFCAYVDEAEMRIRKMLAAAA